eukprot:6173669-Pleurochrysis_carterae.AAC.1
MPKPGVLRGRRGRRRAQRVHACARARFRAHRRAQARAHDAWAHAHTRARASAMTVHRHMNCKTSIGTRIQDRGDGAGSDRHDAQNSVRCAGGLDLGLSIQSALHGAVTPAGCTNSPACECLRARTLRC